MIDFRLSNLDGHELIRGIKSDERLVHIPVIILTGVKHESGFLSSCGLRADAYLEKPVDPEQIFKVYGELTEECGDGIESRCDAIASSTGTV